MHKISLLPHYLQMKCNNNTKHYKINVLAAKEAYPQRGRLPSLSHLNQFPHILLSDDLSGRESVLQFLDPCHLPVPLIACDPSPLFPGLQLVIGSLVLPSGSLCLLLLSFPLMGSALSSDLSISARHYPVAVAGIVSAHRQKTPKAVSTAPGLVRHDRNQSAVARPYVSKFVPADPITCRTSPPVDGEEMYQQNEE